MNAAIFTCHTMIHLWFWGHSSIMSSHLSTTRVFTSTIRTAGPVPTATAIPAGLPTSSWRARTLPPSRRSVFIPLCLPRPIQCGCTAMSLPGSPEAAGRTGSGTTGKPRYNTIHLEPATVAATKPFSVVVRLTTPGWNTPIPAQDGAGTFALASSCYGQSFTSSDGGTTRDGTGGAYNVCLKAFADTKTVIDCRT